MSSFQAKMGRERLRMWEKKKLSFRFVQTWPGIGNSKKIAKKVQKIKKHHYGTFSSQNGTGEAENVRKKKILVLIHSNPTRNRDFRKIAKKIQKTKKYYCGFFSCETGRDRQRMREKKNRSYQFLANPE